MGDGARVAAVSNYDHFPADVARLPRVGGLLDPSVERILAIKPDLVIVYATQKELIERLDRARHPVLQLPAQGAARHHDDDPRDRRADRIRRAGRRVASGMDRSLAEIRARTAGLPRPGHAAGVRARSGVAAQRLCERRLRLPARHARDRRRPQCLRAMSSSRRCRPARKCSSPAEPEVIIELLLRRQPEERRHRQGAPRLGRARVGARRPHAPHAPR